MKIEQLNHKPRADDDDSNSNGDEDAVPQRVGDARRRLRSALEIQHKAVFFCANSYFSIKSDDKLTVPDSDEFKQLEKMETESYDLAKAIRKEILQEVCLNCNICAYIAYLLPRADSRHRSYGKAKRLMGKIESAASTQSFAVIPVS